MKTPFLKCNWKNLVYINFQIEPELLVPFLPKDVEPSIINGKTIISIVCFEFSNAQFFGVKIPFHQCFPEINIRVYVQRRNNPNIKGVYFISEMVPKLMTVLVAKFIFGEPFSFKNIKFNNENTTLNYLSNNPDFKMNVAIEIDEISTQEFSEEEKFIIEKEFAFCGKAGKSSKLFQVKHQKWNLFQTKSATFHLGKINHLSKIFQEIFRQNPLSIFATDGSFVEVFKLN